MQKQSFFENLSPEQRGALVGGLVGAGGLGLTAAALSEKKKARNAILAALAGGLGGAGLGYLYGGKFFPNKPTRKPTDEFVNVDPRTLKPREYEGGLEGFKPIPALGHMPVAIDLNTRKPKPAPYEGGFEGFRPILGLKGPFPENSQDPLKNFANQEAPELPAVGGPGSVFNQPTA